MQMPPDAEIHKKKTIPFLIVADKLQILTACTHVIQVEMLS